MNTMSKITSLAGVATLATLATVTPALAVSPGQLEGGSLVYQVRNVSQNGNYTNSVNANACEEVKFSVRLHNVAFGSLDNINVKATLPSGGTSVVSNMTATPDSGAQYGTNGTATVNLSSAQGVVYESGSTVLYDANGNVLRSLPDGVTAGGVNVGSLNGSTTEFVNFKAKVNCPAPGKGSTPTPVTPAPQPTPQALPATGAETGLAGFAGTGALGYAVMQYRRSRKALADRLLNRK